MWKSFPNKIVVASQTRWFWAKTSFIPTICHKLEKRRAAFFQDHPGKCNPFHSCPFLSIHASLSFWSISFTLFNSFNWLLQCFILLFGCHEITSFWVASQRKDEFLLQLTWNPLFKAKIQLEMPNLRVFFILIFILSVFHVFGVLPRGIFIRVYDKISGTLESRNTWIIAEIFHYLGGTHKNFAPDVAVSRWERCVL